MCKKVYEVSYNLLKLSCDVVAYLEHDVVAAGVDEMMRVILNVCPCVLQAAGL